MVHPLLAKKRVQKEFVENISHDFSGRVPMRGVVLFVGGRAGFFYCIVKKEFAMNGGVLVTREFLVVFTLLR